MRRASLAQLGHWNGPSGDNGPKSPPSVWPEQGSTLAAEENVSYRCSMSQLHLLGATDRAYVVGCGLLDQRAVLAFSQGQCHALALVLREESGWDLVAIEGADGTIQHVCVRRPDGKLVDVRGAHQPETLVAAGRVLDVDQAFVGDLVANHGWAPPAVAEAKRWAEEVLERGKGNPPASVLQHVVYAESWLVPEFDVLIVWAGAEFFEVQVRPADSDSDSIWFFYSDVLFPQGESGRWEIEFTRDRYQHLCQLWLEREFSPPKAARQIANRVRGRHENEPSL